MKSFRIIGIMSGSSLDGLDMALCRFDPGADHFQWSIGEAQTIPFPDDLQRALQDAHTLDGFSLMKLDADFGKHIGESIKQWMLDKEIQADLIASHGHTVFHEPALGFTTQIGSGAHIARSTGVDTITHFRAADIAAGGQGAPFAPVIDRVLFPAFDGCVNLGGIVNASLRTNHHAFNAWDIGPCNQALNYLARKAGLPYDEHGALAGKGKPIPDLVQKLTSFYPFQQGQPKGMSNAEVQSTWIKLIDAAGHSIPDLLATVTEAIAVLIENHLRPLCHAHAKLLLTGGGVHNSLLVKKIKERFGDTSISFHIPASKLIDFKECLLMAYLGYLHVTDKSFGVFAVTGAVQDTIGGAYHKSKT